MTTPDQVLNDLRAAITAIDDGDTDAMYGDQNRGVMQAALETIESLTTQLADIASRRTNWVYVNPCTGEVTQGLVVGHATMP